MKSQPSWTEGGVGRFDAGAASPDNERTVGLVTAQAGFDWTPLRWLAFHADGVARKEPSGTRGNRGGIVQAYADVYNEQWALRVGSFWLPTSRENVDPLWNSRYTITYSALNSWIAQEVRPIGLDLQYKPSFYVTLGATVFRGNDTMGTELAARGWTLGNRIAVYDEALPLPYPATTKPFWHDLDGRNGYAERIRVQLPERASLQVTHIDNRAALIPFVKGQVPWQTRFDIVGGTVGAAGPMTLSAEWSKGWTTVGFPGGSYTMDFDTAYVVLSRRQGSERFSVRAEHFATRSHRRTPGDSAREDGRAFTAAWFHEFDPHWRTGLELVRATGDRPGVEYDGFDPRTGGSTVTAELRYSF